MNQRFLSGQSNIDHLWNRSLLPFCIIDILFFHNNAVLFHYWESDISLIDQASWMQDIHELTIICGGQSRALMAADIAIISDSPIVFIDEIENEGIKKQEALKLLTARGKIVLVVTHDPVLALMTKRRIVM
jgi:hypothetical protein